MPDLNADDLDFITQALGRKPQGVIDIPVRTTDHQPAVITCHPLREQHGEMVPFPTFYWLVCPTLCKQLADLERDGVITAIEQRLHDDPALLKQLVDDHHRYIQQRLAALPPVDRIRAHDLKTKGIAGIADFTHVKCLHAHYAHHLADRNTVGHLLQTEHGITLP